METMQLPSRVIDVMAALKTQGYDMKFESMVDGDIDVKVYKDKKYHIRFYLLQDKGFDMLESDYTTMCNVIDLRVQKKSAAVLKYLEGIIEY